MILIYLAKHVINFLCYLRNDYDRLLLNNALSNYEFQSCKSLVISQIMRHSVN